MSKTPGFRSPVQNSAAVALRAQLDLGLALHQQGKLAEAERIYRKVLRQQPNHFDVLHLLGVIAVQTGRTASGVELIEKAIRLNPMVAVAHSNLGNALRDLKRPDDALASYDRAIALEPNNAVAYINRGNALGDLKRPEDALASYAKAIALKPDAAAYYNHGNALRVLKRPDDALSSYDKAIALKPDYAAAHNNRGLALQDLKRIEDALTSYDKAIALKPDYAEAYNNRGLALQDLKRLEDALTSYDKAIALKPDYAEAYHNQSLCFLLMGRFEQGWRQFEDGKRRNKAVVVHSYPQPLWLGEENIANKTLFIYGEQGFGDTIQFCRYAKLVEARGAKVIMSAQEPLRRLLEQISATIQIIPTNKTPADFDYHCSLLSLPLALGTTLETIPAPHQYIKADEELRTVWSARLPPKTKPRIGVIWSGSTVHGIYNRSMAVEQLLPIFGPDAHWICLQKEVGEKELALFRQDGRIAFFGDDLRDFSDTAALLDLMDLIITIDTSVAHLAGAMGKPVWIMLPFNPDWRWLLDRNDSPWYPSARLFRQQQIGNWVGVIDQVKNELRSVIESLAPPESAT